MRSIEDMVDVVEDLCDFLGGKYIVLDAWDSIWDAKIEKRAVDIDTVKKIETISKLIEERIRGV